MFRVEGTRHGGALTSNMYSARKGRLHSPETNLSDDRSVEQK